jgi:sortase A
MQVLEDVERSLWMIGLLCVGCCLLVGAQARAYRKAAEQIESRPPGRPAPAMDDLMGRIEIPALALSAPITTDYDLTSLRNGVGHIPGTAMPGGLGTVGLAGHRDSFFRPLRRVSPKMDIRLIDKTGTYHYIVDSTEIVTPDKVQVLNIVARPELTLITCFPFDYVGAAPRRFIVHAHLLSVSPDAVPALR